MSGKYCSGKTTGGMSSSDSSAAMRIAEVAVRSLRMNLIPAFLDQRGDQLDAADKAGRSRLSKSSLAENDQQPEVARALQQRSNRVELGVEIDRACGRTVCPPGRRRTWSAARPRSARRNSCSRRRRSRSRSGPHAAPSDTGVPSALKSKEAIPNPVPCRGASCATPRSARTAITGMRTPVSRCAGQRMVSALARAAIAHSGSTMRRGVVYRQDSA